MRHLRLFKRRPFTAAALAAVLIGTLSSCIGNGEPNTPNPSPLSASMAAFGSLILTNCGPITGSSNVSCTFSGAMMNNGPGCAAGISGTTLSSDSTGAQVGSAPWTYSGTVLAGATATYMGTGLQVPGNNAPSNYHTTINFTSVVCPS